MKSENYFYMSEDPSEDITSYEEQLLLNYDDYLKGNLALTSNSYNRLETVELEENLEDDFDSEYDENDWQEEEAEESENLPGTFEMMATE